MHPFIHPSISLTCCVSYMQIATPKFKALWLSLDDFGSSTLKFATKNYFVCVCVRTVRREIISMVMRNSLSHSLSLSLSLSISLCVSLCLSLCVSLCLSLCVSLSVSLSVSLCEFLSVCVCVCLSLSLTNSFSVYLFAYPAI